MKGLRLSAGVVLAGAVAAAAQAQISPPRGAYTNRVQMHKAPIHVQVPTDTETESSSVSKSLGLEKEPGAGFEQLDSQVAVPPPPVRPVPAKKKEEQNWLVLPASPEKDSESTKQKEEALPDTLSLDSGSWGWLADDAQQRIEKRDSEERARDKEEEEDRAAEKQRKADTRREREEKKTAADQNLLLDDTHTPVLADQLGREPLRSDSTDTGLREAQEADRKTDQKKERTAEKKDALWGEETDKPDDRFNPDKIWGEKSIWDRTKEGPTLLPQTAALLEPSYRKEDRTAGKEPAAHTPSSVFSDAGAYSPVAGPRDFGSSVFESRGAGMSREGALPAPAAAEAGAAPVFGSMGRTAQEDSGSRPALSRELFSPSRPEQPASAVKSWSEPAPAGSWSAGSMDSQPGSLSRPHPETWTPSTLMDQ